MLQAGISCKPGNRLFVRSALARPRIPFAYSSSWARHAMGRLALAETPPKWRQRLGSCGLVKEKAPPLGRGLNGALRGAPIPEVDNLRLAFLTGSAIVFALPLGRGVRPHKEQRIQGCPNQQGQDHQQQKPPSRRNPACAPLVFIALIEWMPRLHRDRIKLN